MPSVAYAAAGIHRHLCECPKHGYTQGAGRWGGFAGTEVITVCGREYIIDAGDFDCSSSTVYAWQKALEGTPYEGVLGHGGCDSRGVWRSWYTGNMRALFVGSGLFEWVPVERAVKGDLYLNERAHVAMCQGDGMLSEFLLNENGGITGGQMGDQTGGESVVRPYWDFPWDGCLHLCKDVEIGDIVTEDDINRIAERVWNFQQNGVKVRDRLQGTDQAANGALRGVQDVKATVQDVKAALLAPSDATGRKKMVSMRDRLAWVGKRMDDIQAEQAAQRRLLEQIAGKL